MKGRKPKPTARQISEGDPRQRGKGKLEAKLAKEPKAARGFPPCPSHVKDLARRAWRFWVEELEAMSLDCRPDAMTLEGACVNYARAVMADSIVQREGLLLKEPEVQKEGDAWFCSWPMRIASRRAHPAIAVSNAAWRQLRAFASEFGLSPVSRTRLVIEKRDDGEADLFEILSRPRAPREPAAPVN